jgi:gliding motility-associated-like protein
MKRIIFVLIATCSIYGANAQLTSAISNSSATYLAQMMAGPGVTISNAGFFGQCDSAISAGQFYATPNTVFGLDSGVVLSSGRVTTLGTAYGINTPLTSSPGTTGAAIFATNTTNGNSDADLVTLGSNGTTTITINDACVLEFDFIPLGDTVKFDYVFGSEEYTTFNCSINDIFGFFISGPGITGTYSGALNAKNIALIPGTNFPVAISTINNGVGATATNSCGVNTGGNGPYTQYYLSNVDSFNAGVQTGMSYTGFSKTLTALTTVQPCSTYHLKLAVGDASDSAYDTGVFLKAGSLSSNAISFTPISNLLAPYPYIVEGCAQGYIKVKRPVANGFPYSINYQLGGSASAADYVVSTLPTPSPAGQVTIGANDTVAYISFFAVQDGISEPLEEIKVYQLAPCSNNIIDSSSLFISDTIQMSIITQDTSICAEDFAHVLVLGSDSLVYTWSPTLGVNNPNIKEPNLSPTTTTTYTVCATLPNSGCAPKCDNIKITINQPPNVNIGNDTIVCKNMAIQFNPIINPVQTYTYSWSGSGITFLNNPSTSNPIGTFIQEGNYQLILNVDPIAQGCQGRDTFNILVLPNDITLFNGDTTVCKGASFPIDVAGHPLFTYNWTPPTYLNNPFIEDPIANPDTVIKYTVTATYPGCIPMIKSFNVDVQPVPNVYAGIDRQMCNFDTVQLHATVQPSSYPNYIYNWTPNADLNDPTSKDPSFSGNNTEFLSVIVSTPIGCSDTDFVSVTVNSVEFASVNPSEKTICPRDTVFFTGGGGIDYHWSPNYGLSDSTIINPYALVYAPTEYKLYSTSPQGCVDTDIVKINVGSSAVLNVGEDVTLYPGESVELFASGNCSYFEWIPNYHLTANNIKNPIANPPVTTQYIVYGTTENGCEISDSITIRISEESVLDLPNAFSPGSGTSVNDELKILKRGIVNLNYFRVYNRWGELVFETKEIDKGWDGQFKGKAQPMGVYVYTIDAITSTGKRFYKQGNITLIR